MNAKAIKPTESDINRFWAKIDVKSPEECWEWKAGKTRLGYGEFGISGKIASAHRVAWSIANGPIPEGKLILHKCDNRGCCNPDHLYACPAWRCGWSGGSMRRLPNDRRALR